MHYLRIGFLITLFCLESGCGAIQFVSYTPNTEKDKWAEWIECLGPIAHGDISHSVFCLEGEKTKPPVLLLHELNGLTEETLYYATELSNDFTVYLPMLFGNKGSDSLVWGLLAYWWPYGEWKTLPNESSLIVVWLRELVQRIHDKHETRPIRIIGNCLTGALPLALLGDPKVDAVVVAQPALPMKFFGRYTPEDRVSLELSEFDLNLAHASEAKIFALRFETDMISPSEKHKRLQNDFGTRLISGEICATDYQPEGELVTAHSTLIGEKYTVGPIRHLSRKKRDEVRNFLLQHFPDGQIENSVCSSKSSREKETTAAD